MKSYSKFLSGAASALALCVSFSAHAVLVDGINIPNNVNPFTLGSTKGIVAFSSSDIQVAGPTGNGSYNLGSASIFQPIIFPGTSTVGPCPTGGGYPNNACNNFTGGDYLNAFGLIENVAGSTPGVQLAYIVKGGALKSEDIPVNPATGEKDIFRAAWASAVSIQFWAVSGNTFLTAYGANNYQAAVDSITQGDLWLALKPRVNASLPTQSVLEWQLDESVKTPGNLSISKGGVLDIDSSVSFGGGPAGGAAAPYLDTNTVSLRSLTGADFDQGGGAAAAAKLFTLGFTFNGASNNIPEPASLALIGLGLFGLGLSGRRRRVTKVAVA